MILSCPYCKAKADPATSTCRSCGKTMSRACGACAETIAANSASCKYCGETVKPGPEPLARKADCGIVFIEPKQRKRCCAARGMFWVLILALAGFCAYSALRTRMSTFHGTAPAKQETSAPGKEF